LKPMPRAAHPSRRVMTSDPIATVLGKRVTRPAIHSTHSRSTAGDARWHVQAVADDGSIGCIRPT